jgi:hypothetical protein
MQGQTSPTAQLARDGRCRAAAQAGRRRSQRSAAALASTSTPLAPELLGTTGTKPSAWPGRSQAAPGARRQLTSRRSRPSRRWCSTGATRIPAPVRAQRLRRSLNRRPRPKVTLRVPRPHSALRRHPRAIAAEVPDRTAAESRTPTAPETAGNPNDATRPRLGFGHGPELERPQTGQEPGAGDPGAHSAPGTEEGPDHRGGNAGNSRDTVRRGIASALCTRPSIHGACRWPGSLVVGLRAPGDHRGYENNPSAVFDAHRRGVFVGDGRGELS